MDHDVASHELTDVRGYLSYSHADQEMVRRLSLHLIPAARAELAMDFWTDASVAAGTVWREEIADAIERASIFVLCMSPEYLASEYLYHVELPRDQATVPIFGRADHSGYLERVLVVGICWRPSSRSQSRRRRFPGFRLASASGWLSPGGGADHAGTAEPLHRTDRVFRVEN